MDTTTVSNNGDMERVLATVFQTIEVFLNRYPDKIVAFVGSSQSRTRLYQIAIAKELENAVLRYKIWGLIEDRAEIFIPGISYKGFLISRKNINIV